MKPLITPVPNLNGNSAGELIERLRALIDALTLAGERLADAGDVTHGRNFQHLIKGNDWSEHNRVVNEARLALGERAMLIGQLINEFMALAINIQLRDSAINSELKQGEGK
jgi:hypothetical protein